MLVSVITPELRAKRSSKLIKKQEAQDFIEYFNIPSYIEVCLENRQNVDILDRHLRIIMNPPTNMYDHPEEEDYLYRPLFEIISLKTTKKKKKKKTNDKWVQRLYQKKTDYSQVSSRNQVNQSMYGGMGGHSTLSESTFLNPAFAHGS